MIVCVAGMIAPGIVDGTGVAATMASMVGGGAFIHGILVLLMIMALILSIMTAMAGSSRTLYQGSVDGWLPRYLSHVNSHGAPTRAMWTDLGFNLILLTFAASDAAAYYFILAISNGCYIIFNFLNLNAGWIHRIDSGHIARPYKAPTIILALGGVFAFVNAAFMGAGAAVWDLDPENGVDPRSVRRKIAPMTFVRQRTGTTTIERTERSSRVSQTRSSDGSRVASGMKTVCPDSKARFSSG